LSSCSSCQPVTLIHGPPGTGKTTTLAAVILSAVANGERVLVTAPSHAACDAATAAIAKHWPHQEFGHAENGNLVRQAPRLRITDPTVIKYRPKHSVGDEKICKLYLKKANRPGQMLLMEGRRRGRQESTLLRDYNIILSEQSRKQKDAEKKAVLAAKVVVCTNAIANLASPANFDLVCCDEAGFADDSSLTSLLLKSKRVIMSGDHLQLPPVIISPSALAGGLGVSLFERLGKLLPHNIILLNAQYRSNELISGWSSKHFYGGDVLAATSVAKIKLHELPNVARTAETEASLLFIDTSGEGYTETSGFEENEKTDEDEALENFDEALVVEMLVKKFLHLGVLASDIGIITPYWSQVALLRSLLWSEPRYRSVEVRTVDGYQGREKELIILSLVRSNPERKIGFLKESRRMNVAVTRAKRCCIVIGNAETLSSDHAITSFVNYCRENNALMPVKDVF
jgi:ATP-dependent RNA/DNA helicase IGHMBP2